MHGFDRTSGRRRFPQAVLATAAIVGDRSIQILAADGAGPPQPIRNQQGRNRDPAWSPDGQWIAFSSDRQ
jgi:Tol biopolymer transport system component